MKAVFLTLSILTVASLVAIGYFIAVTSVAGIIASILAVFLFMGIGFGLKRKVSDES
ncbi:DUF5325 family protein [Caenibacillus caldisaponilyticus]|uniref:DUF5325 family protein n=1 Tax=Caenibacillus caldisaponilyticus TaxID=1674942 RepID=UPI001300D4EA|nr:DUF5325 family protein [Caenibacillus caldisaponilyticus]